jgi:hypothetical protein
MSRLRTLAPGLLPALAVAALCVASAASADWPSSPTVNLPVCTATNLQVVPAIATDMAGGAFIAWQDLRNNVDTDIYAQHVLASGVVDATWPTNGLLICSASGNQVVPRAVSDGAGGVILAWGDNRAAGSDVYASHVRVDATLDPAWPPNGLAVCTAAGIQASVQMVSDDAGGAVLLWRDSRNDTDLYAARVFGNGQLDPAWPANGLAVASGPGAQVFAQSASDGHGGMVCVWQDSRDHVTTHPYAQHLLANGTIAPGWPANGIQVCAAAGAQTFPSVDSDGAGGAFVSWEDLRNGPTTDVYTHHVRLNGTLDPAWPVDGRATTLAPGNQTRPRVLGDPAGGAYVAWIDARAGSVPALYAQHLLANGTLDPAWPATDLGFNLAFGNHANLVLLPDGSGGALAVWDDGRSGFDVYAHHLLAGGFVDPNWPVNGRGVSTATQSQNAGGAAIADGSGGLIAAWSDGRTIASTNNDIYAQRVQANGQLGGTVVGVASRPPGAFALAPVTPTPSRSGRFGVRYTLPSEGDVTIELLDIAGRRLASRELGVQSAGAHDLQWKPTPRLPAGLHFVRLRFGAESRMARAITLE